MANIRVLCILFLGLINGCGTVTVPELYNQALKNFYEKHSFDDPEIKDFIIEGKLVAPFFSPSVTKNYETFDIGISLLTTVESATIDVLKISIEGMEELFVSRVTMIANKADPNGIFYDDKFLDEEIEISKLEEIADQNRKLKVTVVVMDGDVEHKINYPFVLGIKRVAAPFL